MKKTFVASILFAFSLAMVVAACKNDDDDEGTPTVDYAAIADCSAVDPNTNTYTAVVKPILDAGCALSGCHDAATANEGVNLSTYAGAKKAFEEKNALCSIHHGSGCTPMPQVGDQLPDASINKLDCWVKNGFKQ